MLGLAEFRALSQEVQALGWAADLNIRRHIDKKTSKQQAIEQTNEIADQWEEDYGIILSDGTKKVMENAADYYNNQLGLGIDLNTAITDIQAIQQTQQFYGATVKRRQLMNMMRLRRQISQTAAVDPMLLGGLFSDPVPFGAHTNVAKRLLLGTAVQAEHNTAKYFAEKGDVPFIRWTLSHQHKKEDECDERANYVDRDVVDYIAEHHLDLDPHGLYFRADLPLPPHPNCQCEYHMVTEKGKDISEGTEHPSGRLNKAFHAVRKALQRIRGK